MDIQPKQLVQAVSQLAEEKNLDEAVLHDIVEQALASAYKKDFGDREQEVEVKLNEKTGDMVVLIHKETTDKVEDDNYQISLKDAQKINPDIKIGETVVVKAEAKPFGRVAAQTAKQVIMQKIREFEKEIILDEYEDKVGKVINGVVTRVEPKLARVDLGKAQGILPMSEQIRGEHLMSGQRVKVYLKDVERTPRGPQVILSRANGPFIEFLFESEVPEMENGAVEIKGVAREAGVRSKIAVHSNIPGVDPVGTFVGGRGTRVQAVSSEIGDDEKIDIVQWDNDPVTFISHALSPTSVNRIELDEANNKAKVYVDKDQQSIAIGRGGQNVRLASKLTGWEIDIVTDDGNTKSETVQNPVKKKIASKAQLESDLIKAVESQQD